MSQDETAAAAGFVRNYIYKIESRNVVAVTVDTLDALAGALRVKCWQLVA
jgi:transcriptional regulator with XRE-family HTH domain